MQRFSTRPRVQGLLFVLVATSALAFSLSVLPAFAAEPPARATDDTDAIAKALTKLDDDWSQAAATRDAARVASFYAEDAIVYPPNEPVSKGRAAAEKVWASYFAVPTFSISWKTVHAEAAKSGDLGFTTGTYQVSLGAPDGKPIVEKGKYVCIWKKQKDGSWKAAHDIWNSDAK